MATQYLKCTFESGIVLQATSNTQGRSDVLDFVPGSKFVGVAAGFIISKKVDDLDFSKLHDGTIRFLDATLYKEEAMTYKVPLSYHKPKVGEQKVYNHHHLTDEDFKSHQFVQIRSGYISPEGKVYEPLYSFRHKSTRNTKTDEMYGYDAAQRAQEWIFAISSEDETLLENVLEAFVSGKHRIGKSKRVEYGKVAFERLHNPKVSLDVCEEIDGGVFLYAKSRLALFDPETGQPAFEPTVENLGLSGTNAEINWEKTQIRTTTFSPFNNAQKTQTYERLLVEKGSIIALQGVTYSDIKDKFDAPIGAFINEGLGEIVINPSFLKEKEINKFELQKSQAEAKSTDIEKYSKSDTFIDALVSRKREKMERAKIIEQINAFVDENKEDFQNMNAQWGVIRSIVAAETSQNAYKAVKTFVNKGISAKEWEGKSKIVFDYIEEKKISDIPSFLLQVAQQMQLKGKNNSNKGGE